MPFDTRKIAAPVSEAARQVAKGIAFLDREIDAHWRTRLFLRRLNIGTRYNCVLGQLFGSYSAGLAELGITTEQAIGFGFDTDSADMAVYQALTREWHKQLQG